MNFQMLKKVVIFYSRFTVSYSQIGYLARSVFWSPTKLNFKGQHWLVTGASGGIGRQIALDAALAGAKVTAAARNPAKLNELAAYARQRGIQGFDTAVCDFSLQADTFRFAQDLIASGVKIDVLVNNVGVMNSALAVTSEGRESSFTINILSHYLLTEALIRHGAFSSRPLVINMTSGGGYNQPLNPARLNNTNQATFNGIVAYGCAKRGQMVLNQYWRDRYGPRGFTFYVMHPGWADTGGVQRSMPRFRKILQSVLRNTESAADTALWLAAIRPPQKEQELVWFDRKPRTAHVYARTRITQATPQSLVDFLEIELARIPSALP